MRVSLSNVMPAVVMMFRRTSTGAESSTRDSKLLSLPYEVVNLVRSVDHIEHVLGCREHLLRQTDTPRGQINLTGLGRLFGL